MKYVDQLKTKRLTDFKETREIVINNKVNHHLLYEHERKVYKDNSQQLLM